MGRSMLWGRRTIARSHAADVAAVGAITRMLSVAAIEPRAVYVAPLERLGYRFVPAPESPDHHFFAKPPERPRSHHLHVCEVGSEHEFRHLALRDSFASTATRRPATRGSSVKLRHGIPKTDSRTSRARTPTSQSSSHALSRGLAAAASEPVANEEPSVVDEPVEVEAPAGSGHLDGALDALGSAHHRLFSRG